MMIFAGSSNQGLAEKLARKAGVKLGEMELSRFANDEARVWIKEKKTDKEAVVVQSLSSPTDHHLIEFCLICDALKRKGVKEITAIIPWLGYSKQDKVFRDGEPLSVKIIAKMLQVVALEKIITFDLHNLAILGFFDVPVVNLTARSLLIKEWKKQTDESTVLVAPDAGAVKSSTALAQELGVEVVYVDKKRDLMTGEVSIYGISRPVKGKKTIIADDLIVTGGTLIKTAEFLKQEGALSIEAGATHHLYVPGVQEKLDQSRIDRMMVTDTVEAKVESGKIKVISVADLLAEQLNG